MISYFSPYGIFGLSWVKPLAWCPFLTANRKYTQTRIFETDFMGVEECTNPEHMEKSYVNPFMPEDLLDKSRLDF